MRTPPKSMRTSLLLLAFLTPVSLAQDVFTHHCAGCHGAEARGSAKAPGLFLNPRVAAQSPEQLKAYLVQGNPGAGMPAFPDLSPDELATLAKYLRRLNQDFIPNVISAGPPPPKIAWSEPQPGDWRTYNGHPSANRYSPLRQIDRANVAALQLKWVFPIPYFGLEVTPLAADGVLYVTGPNQVYALDAVTGQPLWQYSRPATPGMVGDAKLGTNRGVALWRDRVFFLTDNAHLLALDRANGKLLWDVPMARGDRQHYGGTMAPLIVNDMIIAGVSGADEGIRGFVAAFNAETGDLLWRHWTVPARGEPGSETWQAQRAGNGRRVHLAHRLLRSRVRHPLLAHRQSLARLRTTRTAPATISTPTACWLSTPTPAPSSGTTSSRPTT